MRALPYRTPAPDAILAGPWMSEGIRLAERIDEGWDYGTKLSVRRSVTIDVDRVRREAGLVEKDELVVSSRYWALGSLIRHPGSSLVIDQHTSARTAEVQTGVSVDGADLSGALVVETTLTTGQTTASKPFVARRAGSILWRSTEQFAVEGAGGLLPLSRTHFAGSTLPKGAWFVSAGSGGWEEPAMGQLLVLLNEDNPGVVAALEGTYPLEAADLVWQALTLDVVHTVLSVALSDPEFVPAETDSSELSKAALATGFLRTWYARPGEETTAALARLRYDADHDPAIVRAVLQERLNFLRKDPR